MRDLRVQISQISDHLYLSGFRALSSEALAQLGITCVINVTPDRPFFLPPDGDTCKAWENIRISACDAARVDLSPHFKVCATKMDDVKRAGGKTLVHCQMGISRSATLCLAYLVLFEKMTLRDAYFFLKSKRSVIHPNHGFWQQLVDFELKVLGKSSVEMLPFATGMVPDVYKVDFTRHMMWLNGYADISWMLFMFVTFSLVDWFHSCLWTAGM